jgi:hypothetical protein
VLQNVAVRGPLPAPNTGKAAHSFFDKTNLTLTGVSLLGQTADAVTTQRGLKHGLREGNSIARPFVNQGWAGQAGLAVVENSVQVGAMYLAHRRGFHRVERVLPILVGLASGFAAYRNLQINR